MNLSQLQLKINNAKDLDFGTIFNQSMELFKKVWVQGLLNIIIVIAFLFLACILMYIPLLFLGVITSNSYEPNMGLGIVMLISLFVLLTLFICFIMVVAFAFQAAFFRMCMQKDFNIIQAEDHFYFFKKKYISKILTLTFATILIQLVAAFLCFFPLIYVMVPVSFFSIMFAFNPELSTTEIIKASFALGNKKWLLAFGLTIVASFLAEIIGFMMCFVGIFVTASFIYLPLYHIYKEVVGFEDTHEINRIGDNQEF